MSASISGWMRWSGRPWRRRGQRLSPARRTRCSVSCGKTQRWSCPASLPIAGGRHEREDVVGGRRRRFRFNREGGERAGRRGAAAGGGRPDGGGRKGGGAPGRKGASGGAARADGCRAAGG